MNYKSNPHCMFLTIHFIIWLALISHGRSRVASRTDEFVLDIAHTDGGLCIDVMKNSEGRQDNPHKMNPICNDMVPRNGLYQAEQTSTSPWKIYTWKPEIQQHLTHPVVLGSDDGKQKFVNYMISARSVDGGHIVGHFEYQWDAIPVCCYPQRQNYEGSRIQPNLLVGAQGVRVQKPNQTVLWTAPRFFEGPIVFVATFWKSGKLYWPNVTSSPIQVIKRNVTKQNFRG